MKPLPIVNGSCVLELACGVVDLGMEITEAAWSSATRTYLAVHAPKSSADTEEIVAISENGEILLRLGLPKGWRYYYFTSHVDYPLAMVCTSAAERFDWYWGIDIARNTLVSLNRAY